MTYQQTLEYLFSALPMYQRIGNEAFKKGLDNIIALCDALGNPQHKFRSVHIAGTNGKGSTSHSIAAVLQSSGYKTGLYTSPHLKSFTERIRIDGAQMSEAAVVEFVQKNKALLDSIKPSFFEMTVAMAFAYFAENEVDIAIIEVGLGGRLDSTNIITPLFSVITNISFDHTEMLGNTLPLIASEKAGIIKKAVPVVVGEYQAEVAEVFKAKAAAENAPLYFASEQWRMVQKGYDSDAQIVDIWKDDNLYFANVLVQLQGQYQLKNLPAIFAALDLLQTQGYSFSEHDVREGLANVVNFTGLKGRWYKLGTAPLTICDTGHNESGIKEVVAQIQRQNYEQLYIVLGVVREKDLSKFFPLLPQDAYYFFCQPSVPRGLAAEELAAQAIEAGLKGEIVPHPNAALMAARQRANVTDFIFVGGSTFVVADIEEL